jgi:type IV pilus assembly protein PilM
MLKLKPKYPIGIDIDDQNVYAVQLEHRRTDFAVRGLLHRELNGDAEGSIGAGDGLVSLLKEIRQNRQFRGRRVVAHLSSQNVFSFPIQFQLGEKETLEEAILRQSKEHLPFPLEQTIIDYPSITEPPPSEPHAYRAAIIAVRRDLIEQYLHIFNRAGLEVETIDYGISSLIRLHGYLFNIDRHPIILGNMGYTQSMLSAVTADSILAQRSIPWGVGVLLGRIQTQLELSDDRDTAKMLLKKYGLLYEDRRSSGTDVVSDQNTAINTPHRTIYQIVTPHIDEWINEFRKITSYLRSKEPNLRLEGIYLYGYAPLISNLDRYLEKRLEITTTLVNPMTKVALADDHILPDISEGAPFGLALGLGMRKESWL